MTHSRLSPRFFELQRQGKSATEIAAEMRVDPRTVTRWRRKAELTRKTSPLAGQPASRERLSRALVLLEDGASYKEVCRTLHMNPRTVRQHFPGYGWSKLESSQLAAVVRRHNHVFQPSTTRPAPLDVRSLQEVS